MSFIELEHVSFEYPNASVAALDDVSLTIQEGERVALVGSNGSGKTTLARMLNALYLPTAGKVRVAGMDTADLALHRSIRQVVGMVFQNPEDQIVAAVVEEDVAFGMENLGVPTVEMRRRVDDTLQTFDLWEHRQRPPFLLSAGPMQRLALAGVLVMEPRVVVCDETTAMLDPAGRRTVMARIDELHRGGATIIYITHFMGEAARAERVIALSRGRVELDGPPHEVFSDAERLAQLGLHLPPAAALANPASVYCEGLGYTEETRTKDAGQYGVCIFGDGSECDSWAFLAGRCGQEHSYCAQQGYRLEANADSNIGTCVFDDGSSCDEYAYFQGECEPGE